MVAATFLYHFLFKTIPVISCRSIESLCGHLYHKLQDLGPNFKSTATAGMIATNSADYVSNPLCPSSYLLSFTGVRYRIEQ